MDAKLANQQFLPQCFNREGHAQALVFVPVCLLVHIYVSMHTHIAHLAW